MGRAREWRDLSCDKIGMSVNENTYGGCAPDAVIPIRAAGLGVEFACDRVLMTKRRAMAYATGIGAEDAIYLDDAQPGGVVAPLAITCAMDWPVFTTPGWLAAVGRTRETLFNHLVHGAQITEFHNAIRPGQTLEIRGRIVEMRQTRAGALVTARIETGDALTGLPIATGWFASIYRDTPLDGPSGSIEEVPSLRAEAAVPGRLSRHRLSIAKGQAHIYTECADIWNPIHTEREFALASGLPDIILHGTCTWAKTLQLLAGLHRPGDALPFRRFGARFAGYVVPGQDITVEHGPLRDGAIPFAVRTAEGRLALSHGLAELA